ncbi:MAG: 4Fe-4S dicluster domain-containing protein [Anaerolineales bacterium]|nr:MAG: 4Fe-4S dicluster domain-containing protein [Anaerolineales bacterium]
MIHGLGLAKSFWVTLRRMLITYWEDIRYLGRRYRPENIAERQSPRGRGIMTVQYPKERMPLPEAFRQLPFLLEDPGAGGKRCTACGICAQVCPPQCIWIERATDPETGKVKREPSAFHIDVSICMSCGLCAEFCPSDAIKMDHDYELATYDRSFLWDMDKLTKPVEYHAKIHPTAHSTEQADLRRKAALKKDG